MHAHEGDQTIEPCTSYVFLDRSMMWCVSCPGYADEVPLMAKFLWRKGYLRIPTTCTESEHGTGDDSTCRASCPAEVRTCARDHC